MSTPNADPPDVVEARPVLMSQRMYGYALAVVVFLTFLVVALVMRRANDGVPFTYKDQWGTAFVGFVLAGLCLMPTRPRLRADREAIRTRAFLGGWRTIPWEVVVRLDFPRNVRFARVVLPARGDDGDLRGAALGRAARGRRDARPACIAGSPPVGRQDRSGRVTPVPQMCGNTGYRWRHS